MYKGRAQPVPGRDMKQAGRGSVDRDAYDGGRVVAVPTPLDRIPVFLRDGARLPVAPTRG